MKLNVTLKKRDFTDPVGFPDVEFRPERYGWSAIGGPDFAEIAVGGEPQALWSLLNWLRAPVEITDERNEAVWWGYVNEVRVCAGAVEVGASLAQMTNRVAVTYSYIAPGTSTAGTRATTSWAQDDDSVSTYGTRELLNSRDGCSTDAAEARRDAILDRLKYPVPQVSVAAGSSELRATLYCLGWWHSLDWTYYTRAAGLESHEDGSDEQKVGEAGGNTKLAQSFQLTGGEAWDASSIAVKISKTGSPTDTFYIDLCSDSSGSPGTVLSTGSQTGPNLPDSRDWLSLTLASEVPLSPSTTYWIVLRRSGAVDASNYVTVTVDEDLWRAVDGMGSRSAGQRAA